MKQIKSIIKNIAKQKTSGQIMDATNIQRIKFINSLQSLLEDKSEENVLT